MKKILVVILSLFFFLTFQVFSYDADITTNIENISLDETFELKISLKNMDDMSKIEISKINGIENFDIVGQSQSSRIMSESVMNNGNLEEKRETITTLVLILRPKSIGSFTIGPAVLDDGNEQKETNSIKIFVGKSKNELKITPSSIDNSRQVDNISKQENNQVKENFEENSGGEDFFSKNKYIIIFSLFFIFGFISVDYFFRKRKNNLTNNLKEEREEYNYEKVIPEISLTNLPSEEDNDFLDKIEDILKYDIYKKYNLNIHNKTLNEILSDNEFPRNYKDELLEINLILNKLKYSNLDLSRQELLEKVKNFLKYDNIF